MTEHTRDRDRKGLAHSIEEHPFFANLSDEYCNLLGGCARNLRFEVGEFILREGEPADEFCLIREGRAALEVHIPGHPELTFQTLGPGEVVGVSWLVSPYRWSYDARALERIRAIGVDARCLRNKCDSDHDLGYDMMNRFLPVLVQRLQATRLQLLDVYGQKH